LGFVTGLGHTSNAARALSFPLAGRRGGWRAVVVLGADVPVCVRNPENRPHGEARRRRIAAGAIQGKRLAAIAREEGVARQTIWKQAGTDDVRQIVVAVVNGELDRIGQMFARLLGVIEEALAARVIRAGKDSKPMDLGPIITRESRPWTGSSSC
jgi:hypothetical protein